MIRYVTEESFAELLACNKRLCSALEDSLNDIIRWDRTCGEAIPDGELYNSSSVALNTCRFDGVVPIVEPLRFER
jgi:hypothetical protein